MHSMGKKRARSSRNNKQQKAPKHDEGQTAGYNELDNESSSDEQPVTPPSNPHPDSPDHNETPNSGILSPQDPSPGRGIAEKLEYDTDSKAIKASVEKKNGEYILKLTRVSVTAAADQNAAAAEQAQTAALLLSHGELFRALGENLLSQYRASSEKVLYKSLDLQATPRS